MAVNTYVQLDLVKPTPTAIDLSGNFNGRVADVQSYLKLWLTSNGLPCDLTDKTVYFAGVDPDGNAHKVYGTAQTDQAGDNLQTGRITFYFPGGTFRVQGDWDSESTYFGVIQADGTVISTVNVSLHVLAKKVDMGVNSKPFYTDLEKIKTDATTKLQAELDKATKQVTDFIEAQQADITASQTKYNTALNDVIDPTSTLNTGIAALKKTLSAIKMQADANDYVDTTAFNTLSGTVTNLQNSLKALDKRKTNSNPIDYIKSYPAGFAREVNNAADIGITADMLPSGVSLGAVIVDTDVPWTDNTLGWPTQTAKFTQSSRPVVLMRKGTADTVWSAWELVTTW